LSVTAAIMDEDEIRRVIVGHSRGLDRCDEDLVARSYFDDARIDYGQFKGTGGAAAAAALVGDLRANASATTHAVPNSLIDIEDNEAAGETYCLSYQIREFEDARWFCLFSLRYVDRFEKRNHEWRIAERVAVHDWSHRERIDRDFGSVITEYTQGRRDRRDLSYERRHDFAPIPGDRAAS
jgi:hypothetical protein